MNGVVCTSRLSSNEPNDETRHRLEAAIVQLERANVRARAANAEMLLRSREVTRLADELTNGFDGVSLCVLLLDGESRIRRFSPAAAELFGLVAEDTGKELGSLGCAFAVECVELSAEALRKCQALERNIQDEAGRRYVVCAKPSRAAEQRVDGAIVVVLDVDAVASMAVPKGTPERSAAQLETQSYRSRLRHLAFDAAIEEERERRRLALTLHERVGQGMALARIQLSGARDASDGSIRECIDDAMLLLAQSLESTRMLTFELSPPILYDLGLKAALAWLSEDLACRFGLDVQLEMDDAPTPLEDASAALVFRAVRELLLNVVKHAESRRAWLSVEQRHDCVTIRIEDEGVGFDPEAPSPVQAGFGLFSVREQAERLGGSFEVQSALGQGTRTTLNIPLASTGG